MVKRRILHVVYSLDPGGMENGVVNVANSLDKDRFEIFILCLSQSGELSKRLNSDIKVIELNKRSGFDLLIIPQIYRLMADFRPDIVHSHNLGPLIYVILPVISTNLSVQLIQGEHASLTDADLTSRKIVQRMLLYPFCTVLHTVGREMTRHFSDLFFTNSKFCTLQNGVDTERFLPTLDQENYTVSPTLKNKFVISLFARFGKYKGHAYVLDLFEKIASDYPDTILMFVGGGGENESLVLSLVEEHPYKDRIICTGFQQDPVPFYQVSDIVVLASENEGLSNVMLEAMSCSVPVVAMKSCGVSDLIVDGENGFIVPDESMRSALLILTTLLGQRAELLVGIGRNARAFIEVNYSIRSMIKSYDECYIGYSAPVGL